MTSSKQNIARLQSIPYWILILFILAGPLLPTAGGSYVCRLYAANSTTDSDCRSHDECGDAEPADNNDSLFFHQRRNIDENYIPCNCIEYERIPLCDNYSSLNCQVEDLPTNDSHVFLDCIILQI